MCGSLETRNSVVTWILFILLAVIVLVVSQEGTSDSTEWLYDGHDSYNSYTASEPGDVFYEYVVTRDLYEFDTETVNSLTSSDIDRDGSSDVILCHSNTEIVCISGKNDTVIFRYSADLPVLAGPLVLDIDADGICEMVIGLSSGTIKWFDVDDGPGSPVSVDLGNALGKYSQIIALPVEGGTFDLVVVDGIGTVFSLSSDGSQNWVVEPLKEWPRSISVYRHHDGYKVLSATIEATNALTHMESDIVRIDGGTGMVEKELILNRTTYNDFFTTRPSLMNDSGVLNVVIAGRSGYLIDADTFSLRRLNFGIGKLSECIPVQTVSGTGLICRGMDILIHYDLLEGKPLWELRSTITPYNLIGFPIVLCDLDEDGSDEVIVPFLHNIQIVNVTTGGEVARITFDRNYTRGKLITPILCDVDGDDFNELVFSCRLDNWRIRVFTTPNMEFSLNITVSPPRSVAYPEIPLDLGYRITNLPSVARLSRGQLLLGDGGVLPSIELVNGQCTVIEGGSRHAVRIISVETKPHGIEYIFELTLDWQIDTEAFQASVLDIALGGRPSRRFEISDAIRFENDLVFGGPLIVVDSQGAIVPPGSWLRENTTLSFSGGPVLFEGSDVSPVNDTVRIQERRPHSTRYIDAALNGSFTFAEFLADYPDEHWNVSISITDVPFNGSSKDPLEFHCLIDRYRPTVRQVTPEPGVWKAEHQVSVGFDLFDNESGLDVDSVLVSLTFNDSEVQEVNDFTLKIVSSNHILLTFTAEMQEGRNWIRLSLMDMVGNRNDTGPWIVDIDTTQIVFGDFSPSGWSNRTDIVAEVTIYDLNGSGVDLSSVEYSYSVSGLFGYLEWTSMGLSGEAPDVTVSVPLELDEGTENYIRFRARDFAGNENRISDDFVIKIDSTPPQMEIIEEERNHLNVSVTIQLWDGGSGIDEETIGYEVTSGGSEILDSTYEIDALPGTDRHRLTIHCVLRSHRNNTISVQVADIASNSNHSVYSIQVNAPPELMIESPMDNGKYTVDESVHFKAIVSDSDGDEVSIIWMLGNGTVLERASEFERSLEAGRYEVTC